MNEEEFNYETGVGVVVSETDIKALVDQIYAKHADDIQREKWHFNFSALIHRVRDEFKWGDGGLITNLIN